MTLADDRDCAEQIACLKRALNRAEHRRALVENKDSLSEWDVKALREHRDDVNAISAAIRRLESVR